jgi:outer membrane receptor protein involved in Fe transport
MKGALKAFAIPARMWLWMMVLAALAGSPLLAQEPPTAGSATAPSLDDLLSQKVSASAKYEQTVRDAAASVTIVTAQEIETFGFATLAEVLSSVRSFYVSYDRNYDYVGTRGFSRPTDYNDRILLLLDGHAINENTYGEAPIGTDFALPLSSVERVEIVRGPGSALYGTYAMLAVVNVITKSGAALDGLRASAALGSFGRKEAELTGGKRFASGLDVVGSARYLKVDGQDLFYPEYADQGGVARGLDHDEAFAALVSARLGSSSLRAGASWREKGIPTGAFGTIFGDQRAGTIDEREWVDLSHEFPIGYDKALTVRGYYDWYRYDGIYPYVDGLLTDHTRGVWAGGEARLTWDLSSGNRLTLGSEYRYNFRSTYSWETAGVPQYNADVHSSIASAYAQDEVQLFRHFSLTLGLRYDHFSTSGGAVTPRAGIVYSYSKQGTLKLLYGEAFRAPSTYEVLFQAPVGAASPALTSERIRTYELNVEQRLTPWLQGTVSAYHYAMKNLIDQFADAEGNVLYRNHGTTTANGIEVQLDTRLPGGLRATVSYALQAAKDEDSAVGADVLGEENGPLSNSPRNVFKAMVSADVFSAVMVGARFRCESPRVTVYGTESPSYCLTDLNLTSKPLSGFSLSLAIRNLFDRRYSTPGGVEHLQPAIEQDGRSLVGRVSWSF